MPPRIHLICNAHLDPVWLWEWQEGAAEAISTFRTAADLCEEFGAFVFNHNEAILYQWVEEYEPALFARIARLIQSGQWNVMGGWYLQPDCNMPSGESFVRQMLEGRTYFRDRFGIEVTTGVNFDPFGHSRGLVQILARGGYDSYLFCRPGDGWVNLPDNDFIWVGFDGSEILARRCPDGYLSHRGQARKKAEDWIANHPGADPGIVLWGVGNHGGGPSRQDLRDLTALIAQRSDVEIVHSTPQAYFAELAGRRDGDSPRRAQRTQRGSKSDPDSAPLSALSASSAVNDPLPRHAGDLNPWAVGCYTSQIRIKQTHRRLENELFATEKMLSGAWVQGRIEYPAAELADAQRDLLYAQFHDVLPGSSIQPVEEASLRRMEHGLEILSRCKARAFFALAGGQKRAKEGEIPVLVYNPHPHRVEMTVECEFQLADQNWSDTWTRPRVYRGRTELPSQVEKEQSSLNLDWRKRMVFPAVLEPGMNRFDCRLERLPAKPPVETKVRDGAIRFRTEELDVTINARTGLLDRCRIGGRDVLGARAFAPLVMHDNEDPWGMRVRAFRKIAGRFKALSKTAAARLAGVHARALDPVRVIEDGPARTVVEALLGYEDSRICLHYVLPKRGARFEVDLRVHWNEKDRMLKLSLPTPWTGATLLGETAYGVQSLPTNGDESVAQRWVAVVDRGRDAAMTCCNDGTYGSDFLEGELRLSLLRSSVYAGHPIGERPIVPQDRYTPRIDQGERRFRFRIGAGTVEERLSAVPREAQAMNEAPFALSFFPHGEGEPCGPLAKLSDAVVQLSAAKRAHDNDALILRLFNPTARKRTTTLTVPSLGVREKLALNAFEIRTLRVEREGGKVREVNLLER